MKKIINIQEQNDTLNYLKTIDTMDSIFSEIQKVDNRRNYAMDKKTDIIVYKYCTQNSHLFQIGFKENEHNNSSVNICVKYCIVNASSLVIYF